MKSKNKREYILWRKNCLVLFVRQVKQMNKREFVLTDGKNFIKCETNNKYKQTSNLSLAEIYDSQKIATNIMLNSIPKAWSRSYYVAEIIKGEIVQCNAPRPSKVQKPRREVSYQYSNNFSNNKWCKRFLGLDEIFHDAMKRSKDLAQELSDVDAQIVDIEHYIEFTTLNARDGYKTYKKLKELLCLRRTLKFEHKVVNAINTNYSALGQIEKILATINDCNNSAYKPRNFVQLFEKGIASIENESR